MCRPFRALLTALLGAVLFPAGLRAADRWELAFFHDAIDSELTILDLAFPSSQRGVAVGYLSQKGKTRPHALVSSDGGKSWSYVRLREAPLSLFFLNESLGWMVTEKGIWQTVEAGRSWRKLSKLKGVLRVYFLDEKRGWAVGTEKAIHETTDGGKNWTRLPAADGPDTTKEYTTYSWIDFANSKQGCITGYSAPPRAPASRLPDWMDPERAENRRQWPTLTIFIQTLDGGKSWKHSTTSMFGRITRFRMEPSGKGLALVEFQNAFEWPSEVYRIDLASDKTERAYREKNRAVRDVILTGESAGYMAAIEPPGKLRQVPIPGRLVMLGSQDLVNWKEMPVDYRAYAGRPVLASAGKDQVWVATDTGMILKLVRDGAGKQ